MVQHDASLTVFVRGVPDMWERTCSLCDPIDEGRPDFDKAEGQGQTTHKVQMEQTMKDITLSQKV